MPRRSRPAALAAVLVLTACGFVPAPTNGPVPNDEEAIAFMHELVALAEAGDVDGMCIQAEGSSGGNCDGILDEAGGRAAVPEDPPILAGTRVIPARGNDQAGMLGGMLLVLCGTDGLQRPYRTEMLVSRWQGSLIAINAVYWSGFDLAVSENTGSASGGEGIDCPD